MTHVLALAYYFPPIGGAGAQRPARLAHHLVDRGYRFTVVTGPGPRSGRWTPKDDALGREVGEGVDVLRIPTPEPVASGRWAGRRERWLMSSSDWERWWVDGVEALGRTISDVDVVYAYMSPFSSARAAASLASSLGVPWVADLGDPWALDEMQVYPTELHRRRAIAEMRRWLGRADGVIMSTPEAVRRTQSAFPEFAEKPMVAIPNGYEAADFDRPLAPRAVGTPFRIVHTGYLHTDLGLQQLRRARLRRLLGGQMDGVEIITRSHVYLFRAIDRLLREDPSLVHRLEVHLAGVLSGADREVTAGSPVARLHGYVPHPESTAMIRDADMLFLPMQKLPPGTRASIVPGKTYEYLATGRPILAAVPEGDVREILERARTATIVDPDDVDGIATAIRAGIAARDACSTPTADVEYIRGFEYGQLAVRLSAFLEGLLPRDEGRRVSYLADARSVSKRGDRGRRPARASRVLYLAYYFPPIGGAGAQRSLKFVRYLKDNGFEPVVVTGPGTSVGRWTPEDRTLLGEVPKDVEVLRVRGPEPPQTTGWSRRAESWLRTDSAWARWWTAGATAIGLGCDVDVVHASMSPYSTADAASRIAKELGKPWVAELRDPWALDEMVVFPTALHRRLELRRMERSLVTSRAIVVNTAEAASRLNGALSRLGSIPTFSIPNGYDEEDFAGPPPARLDTAFRIVHTGYLHTALGRRHRAMSIEHRLLGGAVPGVDILTRSHVYLVEAIEALLRDRPRLPIELHLAGALSAADLDAVRDRPFVRVHGYVSHADSIALLRTADLLFLPMHDLPPGERATVVPGKTYEYLAARRPILAAVPDGDAKDLLLASGVAEVCRPADVAAMTDALGRQVDRWSNAGPAPDTAEGILARFERRSLTGELAEALTVAMAPQTDWLRRPEAPHQLPLGTPEPRATSGR